jgi:hypothetical protein
MSLATELVTRHRFSAQEYRQMAEAGVFAEEKRLELVDGEIVDMSPIGPRHMEAVIALNALLLPKVADRYDVSVQMPLGPILGERPSRTSRCCARIASNAAFPALRTRSSWWRWPTLPYATTGR